jgi:hypothetical protein
MHGVMRYGHLSGRFLDLDDDSASAGVADGWFQEVSEIPLTGIPTPETDPDNPEEALDPYGPPPESYVTWYTATYGTAPGGGGSGPEIPDGEITIDNATLAAGSPIDTVVGTLTGRIDSGSNGTPTFSLLDDSSGSFKVVGDEVQAAKSDLIGNVTHSITVKATVPGEGWFQNDLDITVTTAGAGREGRDGRDGRDGRRG